MSIDRFVLRLGLLCVGIFAQVAQGHAQCATVNLINAGNLPLVNYMSFNENNTVCRFGGDYAGVRGLVSCISASTPLTASNTPQLENILAKAASKLTMLPSEISRITTDVDFAVIGRMSTTPTVFEFALMNRSKMLDYVQNNYPTYASNAEFVRFNHRGGGDKRTSFVPRDRSIPGTVDVTMSVDASPNFLGLSGYSRYNSASRFMIYRIESHLPNHEYDPFTVCTGPQALLYSDIFHRYGLTGGGLSNPTAVRYIAHN